MSLLEGKVAIVTGAGQGLGRTYAIAMAREGAKLVVNDVAESDDGELRLANEVVKEIVKMGGEAVSDYSDVTSARGGEGLSHLTKKRCDQLVSIPQIGHLESLNVSNAAAITIYEIQRQREMDH